MPATLPVVDQSRDNPRPQSLRLAALSVSYPVTARVSDWELPEGTVPESAIHDQAVKHLVLLLDAWAATRPEPVMIARNLAVRWLEAAPRTGIDPDVCVIHPVPSECMQLDSLRLWLPGHYAPPLCFEVVSKNHPYKDYAEVPERYAAMGTSELVVFDPMLVGPKAWGGPVSLQVWRRDALGALERIYFGPGPFRSEVLDAWLHARGDKLIITEDRDAERPWLTAEERERAEKERERAEKERERAEKERERAEKERERAEKERERAARIALEERLAALERR